MHATAPSELVFVYEGVFELQPGLAFGWHLVRHQEQALLVRHQAPSRLRGERGRSRLLPHRPHAFFRREGLL